jgi:hypothetical protein
LLKTVLVKAGFNVWLDTEQIAGGKSWSKEIEAALNACHALIAVITRSSYESDICRAEHHWALNKKKKIIPVRTLDDAPMPIYLIDRQWRKFPDEKAELLADLAFEAANFFDSNDFEQTSDFDQYVRVRPEHELTALSGLSNHSNRLTQLVVYLDVLKTTLSSIGTGEIANRSRTPTGVVAVRFLQRLLSRSAIRAIDERDVLAALPRTYKDRIFKSGIPFASLLLQLSQQPLALLHRGRILRDLHEPLIGDGLAIIHSLFTLDPVELMQLPTFSHGSLDGAVQLMQLLNEQGSLVSEIILRILTQPCHVNAKTIVAHLGRRFLPLGEIVGDRWQEVLRSAKRTTLGDSGDLLDVEHNVAYLAAMHGSPFGVDNILCIEGDPVRLDALVRYNRSVSRENRERLLAMLTRKSIAPPDDEKWVKPWAGKLLMYLR